MFLHKRIAVLLSFAVLAGILLSIGASPVVEADGDKIKSSFDMKDNPAFTPGVAPAGEEVHGSGKFELDGKDLDNLKFKYKVKANDLKPNTWYQASISIRDLTDPNSDGPDDVVIAGYAKTDKKGKFKFEGKAVLPNPTVSSPKGIVSGWRIDQQIRLPAHPHTILGKCEDCILVCAPTTKVQLNAAGDGLIPGTP